MPRRKKYIQRKSLGLCTTCGSVPAEAGRLLCQQCREDRNESNALNRRLGLCLACSQDALPGKSRCAKCMAANNDRCRKAKASRVANRKCRWCGGNPSPGKKSCIMCRLKRNEWQRFHRRMKQIEERQSAGLCIQCGRKDAEIGHTDCMECRRKSKEQRKNTRKKHRVRREDTADTGMDRTGKHQQKRLMDSRRANGECTRCGSTDVAPTFVRCADCRANAAHRMRLHRERKKGKSNAEQA